MTELKNFYSYLERNNLDIKQHQVEGVTWCLNNEIKGVEANDQLIRGGLLADDMGLGKTVQILAFLSHRYERMPDHDPTLIVVPKSLLFNWRREIERFTPSE